MASNPPKCQPHSPVTLRAGHSRDAQALSELAVRSKAHWGYSSSFMAACRDELVVDAGCFNDPAVHCTVAERSGDRVGFYLLCRLDTSHYELDALFVAPEHIGTGVGTLLLSHALETMARRGGGVLTVQADPHAERFYRRAGAVKLGMRPSGSIPNRQLPVLQLTTQTQSPAGRVD